MMDFDKRLEKAIERGKQAQAEKARADRLKTLTAEEAKRLHTDYRLTLSEHIEECLRRLMEHFPGFRMESIVGEKGWGAALNRDNLEMVKGRRENYFSRLELAVRPFSSYRILELVGKGTIRNKEVLSRSHFQKLEEVELQSFIELIDHWIVEFAELYARKQS